MRRRLLVSNLIIVTIVLLALETPLALIYARDQRDELGTAVQRDANSVAALSEEIIEHPGDHDVGALAQRFTVGAGAMVLIADRGGKQLNPQSPTEADPEIQAAVQQARAGHTVSGETRGLTFVAVPVGAVGDSHGAVLVARSDSTTERRIREFWLVLAGIALAVLVVSIVVSRRVARWAIDPLQQLEEHASALGRGELHARADVAEGPPEITALATTFNEMADRLDELVTAQRRFVADASHQLRTPLTALRLRLENLETGDTAAVAATRDAALRETSRLTRLVDGLLALARAERQRPQPQRVEVADIVAERYEAWLPLAAEHGIDLRLDRGNNDVLPAMAVPGQLEQILDNLIDNAVDATPAGRAVTLGIRANASDVEVHVVDEGPGMSDTERRRAFDPFWQGQKRRGNGTAGLGLAIVAQLVKSSEGTISLNRAATGGIDVTIRLSRAHAAR